MNYVRCINNQTYVHVPGEPVDGTLADLTVGAVYKVLPTTPHERDADMLRIIDNSGEDYLYPAIPDEASKARNHRVCRTGLS